MDSILEPKILKRRKQLKKNAVPCIGITAEPLSDEILKQFPLHIAQIHEKHPDALQRVNIGLFEFLITVLRNKLV